MDERDEQRIMEHLSRFTADRGITVKSGWASFQIFALPPGARDKQVKDMEMAFYAGAQHVFASIMGMLEEGAEATPADMARIISIASELEEWLKKFKKERGL